MIPPINPYSELQFSQDRRQVGEIINYLSSDLPEASFTPRINQIQQPTTTRRDVQSQPNNYEYRPSIHRGLQYGPEFQSNMGQCQPDEYRPSFRRDLQYGTEFHSNMGQCQPGVNQIQQVIITRRDGERKPTSFEYNPSFFARPESPVITVEVHFPWENQSTVEKCPPGFEDSVRLARDFKALTINKSNNGQSSPPIEESNRSTRNKNEKKSGTNSLGDSDNSDYCPYVVDKGSFRINFQTSPPPLSLHQQRQRDKLKSEKQTLRSAPQPPSSHQHQNNDSQNEELAFRLHSPQPSTSSSQYQDTDSQNSDLDLEQFLSPPSVQGWHPRLHNDFQSKDLLRQSLSSEPSTGDFQHQSNNSQVSSSSQQCQMRISRNHELNQRNS